MSLEPPRLEFFGLPGSGKSTLARACWALLADREPRVVFGPSVTRDEVPICPRTLARLGLIGRSLPFDTAERRTVRLIAGLPQPSPKDRAKVLFNALTVAALYRRIGRGAGGFIVDQGVLQAIWSAYLRSPARFAAALWAGPLAAEAVPGRVYVCVSTPVATCIDRLAARPASIPACKRPACCGTMASGSAPRPFTTGSSACCRRRSGQGARGWS